LSDGRPIPADSEYSGRMADSKQKLKPKIDFETFVRAAMATGKPPAEKRKAAKQKPKKQRPRPLSRG